MQRFDGPNYGFIWLYSGAGEENSDSLQGGNYEFVEFLAAKVNFINSLFAYICKVAPSDCMKSGAVLGNPASGGRVLYLFTSFIRCI
jgi:hypothetical protein